MRKPKPSMPPQAGRGFMPPKVTAAAPMTSKASSRAAGVSKIKNLGEYAHPQKKKKR